MISSRSRAGCTPSSSAATRTSSARQRRRLRAGFARAGRRSSPSRRAARGSSTTCPRRCRRCCRPGSCSAAPSPPASTGPTSHGPLAKIREELGELEAEVARAGEPSPETEPDAAVAHEVGDLLFTVVNLARRLNVDPELALRATNTRFVARVERAEELADAQGERWSELPLEEQDRYYDQAKEQLG